jgi:hypothetical protein
MVPSSRAFEWNSTPDRRFRDHRGNHDRDILFAATLPFTDDEQRAALNRVAIHTLAHGQCEAIEAETHVGGLDA